MSESYYARRLSAERLARCYELAPPRARRYLEAEVRHVRLRVRPGARVLELGCGYGRVLRRLADAGAERLTGVDVSMPSLAMARRYLAAVPSACLARMNATAAGFPGGTFDVVFCVQNGICAFHVDQRALVEEAVRVTGTGGAVLFSTYAEAFWEPRLEWFRVQAAHGLVGEIDEDRTGDGVIVCRDGFRAGLIPPDRLRALAAGLGARVEIDVVDHSSVFCEIRV